MILRALIVLALAADPIALKREARVGGGYEADLYAHPTEPGKVIRVAKTSQTSAEVDRMETKVRLLEGVGGAAYYGRVEVIDPDGTRGKVGIVLERVEGTAIKLIESETPADLEAFKKMMEGLAAKGAVAYDPQMLKVQAKGGVRYVPIDPGMALVLDLDHETAHRQAERRFTEVVAQIRPPVCPPAFRKLKPGGG